MNRQSRHAEFRELAQEMIMAGVRSADPRQAIQQSVHLREGILHVENDEFKLADYDRVLLFGIGKASTPMCHAFEEILVPDDGLVITKKGQEIGLVQVNSIPVYQAYHPEPREENVIYSEQILAKIEAIDPGEKVLVVFMVSGGGSALFTDLPEGITIADLYALNELLMKWGGPIHHINTIRKHVSRAKGGRFGKTVSDRGATLVSLILSDVVGDDLSVIASGPTYKDSTTVQEAIDLLHRYKIWDEVPTSIQDYLISGLNAPEREPVREVPPRVHNYLIGNNMKALKAAQAVAEQAGLATMILTSQNSGEAKVIAKCVMGMAKEIQDSRNPVAPPVALIMGGEMIVTFNWEDRDGFGPNREFVLSSAIEIAGRSNIVVAGADTDGEDGQGKSGAIADGETVSRSTLDAQYYLDKHDAEIFFDALGDSLEFTSHTNVNDIVVVLVGPK